jgi:predicted nucleic acid-binding protein
LGKVICNASPLQYLHQLGQLNLLEALAHQVIVPPAVLDEIEVGRTAGISLPDLAQLSWIRAQRPIAESALPLISDLGPGETGVLMLGLELPDSILVLDDGLARQFAEALSLKFTGTLGILLAAKHAGMVSSVTPLLNRLQELHFRLSSPTRRAILQLAGEEP